MGLAGIEISARAGMEVTVFPISGCWLPLRGSADQISQDIMIYQDSGMASLLVDPRYGNAAEISGRMERLARPIWPRL